MSRLVMLCFSSSVVALAVTVATAQVANGDFESGLSGWETSGAVSVFNAPSPVNSALAHITDSGRLWQTLTLPAGAQTFTFDYFDFSLPDSGDTGPPLNDALNIFILDAVSLDSIIPPAPGFESIPAFMLVQRSGITAVNADFVTVVEPDQANETFGTVTVDLASLPGTLPSQVRIEFGIARGDDDFQMNVLLDNVHITVPAPAWWMGLIVPLALRRRARA